MFHAETGELAATSEQLAMHVDMTAASQRAISAEPMTRPSELMATHQALPSPDRVGQRMGIRRKSGSSIRQ